MQAIPEQIKNKVLEAGEKIAQLRRADSLVLALFSDIHVGSVDDGRVDLLCETLSHINAEINLDAVVDLGDNPSMLGRRYHSTNEELTEFFTKLLSKIQAAAGVPLICVNGNHDAVGTDFFNADFWNAIVKNKFGVSNAVYGGGSYFYIDYPRSKTRVIVLSVPCGSDLTAEMPTPLWRYGEEQLEWLEGVALDTDYDILLLCHTPPYDYYIGDMEATLGTWDGEKGRVSTIAALCGWTDDSEKIAEITSSHTRSKILAMFSGHTHFDSLWQPFENRGDFTNPLACTQVVMKGPAHELDEQSVGMAVDIAVWTPSENTFKIFRVGDGEDREIIIK